MTLAIQIGNGQQQPTGDDRRGMVVAGEGVEVVDEGGSTENRPGASSSRRDREGGLVRRQKASSAEEEDEGAVHIGRG